MKISLSKPTDFQLIEHVLHNGIVVNQQTHVGDLIIATNTPVAQWSSKPMDQLEPDDFRNVNRIKPEMVIIGTGNEHRMPNQQLIGYFEELGIGLETMTTIAACRTYNILAEDGRLVIAYLQFQTA